MINSASLAGASKMDYLNWTLADRHTKSCNRILGVVLLRQGFYGMAFTAKTRSGYSSLICTGTFFTTVCQRDVSAQCVTHPVHEILCSEIAAEFSTENDLST